MTKHLPKKIVKFCESEGLNRVAGPFTRQDIAQAYYDGLCRAIMDNSICDGVILQYNEEVYLVYKDTEFFGDEEIDGVVYEPDLLDAQDL